MQRTALLGAALLTANFVFNELGASVHSYEMNSSEASGSRSGKSILSIAEVNSNVKVRGPRPNRAARSLALIAKWSITLAVSFMIFRCIATLSRLPILRTRRLAEKDSCGEEDSDLQGQKREQIGRREGREAKDVRWSQIQAKIDVLRKRFDSIHERLDKLGEAQGREKEVRAAALRTHLETIEEESILMLKQEGTETKQVKWSEIQAKIDALRKRFYSIHERLDKLGEAQGREKEVRAAALRTHLKTIEEESIQMLKQEGIETKQVKWSEIQAKIDALRKRFYSIHERLDKLGEAQGREEEVRAAALGEDFQLMVEERIAELERGAEEGRETKQVKWSEIQTKIDALRERFDRIHARLDKVGDAEKQRKEAKHTAPKERIQTLEKGRESGDVTWSEIREKIDALRERFDNITGRLTELGEAEGREEGK